METEGPRCQGCGERLIPIPVKGPYPASYPRQCRNGHPTGWVPPTTTVDGKEERNTMATKFYVRRVSDRNAAGFAFTGPLAAAQADKELAAWADAGPNYAPTLLPADPTTRAFVRRWQKETRRDDAWEIVTFEGQKMTFAAYRLNHENV